MGFPSKATSASNICLRNKNEIAFNDTKNCSIFKSFFYNLAQNLVSKLAPSPNAFTESKVTTMIMLSLKALRQPSQKFCPKTPTPYFFTVTSTYTS